MRQIGEILGPSFARGANLDRRGPDRPGLRRSRRRASLAHRLHLDRRCLRPLWLTKEAGIFKKYNIEPEFIYIAGGPPSLQALIAGDVAISFTAAGATVAANLQGSDVVLLGATIDSLAIRTVVACRASKPPNS